MNMIAPLPALATTPDTTPFVSIVIPALNEARYIAACITSLIGQWPEGAYEILVLDGGSVDATIGIVAELSASNSAIVLQSNPGRIQSSAMNLAARIAAPQATILIRADAHALYPVDFVQRCVRALLDNGATSVVVPMHTSARPKGLWQQAIAAAQSSRLGNGGAAHRVGARSGFVGHGHHAAFDRAFFCGIHGYDETFTHNEDAELDVRAIAAGGKIWMCAEAPVVYYPRDRLDDLARQYFRHGAGRARTLRKHHLSPRPRQMIPVLALFGCTAGVAIAPFAPAMASAVLLYPTTCLAWALVEALRRRDPRMIAAGAALMTMHLAWASGLVIGFARKSSRQ
ncbi:MAG: glycosyltransferase family 2 protein [Acetobacteraceae bacterium]|nr:glycosyltransferase family 2 protein [Acetobacteraceae bacterium]